MTKGYDQQRQEKMKKRFHGSIVIGDPSYFIKSDEDFEKSLSGENLSELDFTDYLCIDFPDDPQVVMDTDSGEMIGGICQDSAKMTVVYKSELQKYNPDYEAGFFDKDNRTIIENFSGEIESKIVPVVLDGYEDQDTEISGTGNINFRSCYEEDL